MNDDYSDYYDDNDNDRTAPYVRGSATSENAARTLSTEVKHIGLILGIFLEGYALTRDEVVTHINEIRRRNGEDDIVYSSATARMSDLTNAGCLEPTGECRVTGRGRRPAEVLRLVPGTTLDTYLRAKASKDLLRAWRKDMDVAGLTYQQDPTPQNLSALGALALRRPKDPRKAS